MPRVGATEDSYDLYDCRCSNHFANIEPRMSTSHPSPARTVLSPKSGLPLLDQPLTVWVRGVERPVASVVAEGRLRRKLGPPFYPGWGEEGGKSNPSPPPLVF